MLAGRRTGRRRADAYREPDGGTEAVSTPRRELVLDLPATSDSVVTGRRRLVAFAAAHEVGDAVLRDLELAASEVLTNAVLHGYRDREPGRVSVVAGVGDDGMLAVTIADTGHGLRPGAPSEGLGLGMGLVERVADALDIDAPPGGGLRVRMRFALAR